MTDDVLALVRGLELEDFDLAGYSMGRSDLVRRAMAWRWTMCANAWPCCTMCKRSFKVRCWTGYFRFGLKYRYKLERRSKRRGALYGIEGIDR